MVVLNVSGPKDRESLALCAVLKAESSIRFVPVCLHGLNSWRSRHACLKSAPDSLLASIILWGLKAGQVMVDGV